MELHTSGVSDETEAAGEDEECPGMEDEENEAGGEAAGSKGVTGQRLKKGVLYTPLRLLTTQVGNVQRQGE